MRLYFFSNHHFLITTHRQRRTDGQTDRMLRRSFNQSGRSRMMISSSSNNNRSGNSRLGARYNPTPRPTSSRSMLQFISTSGQTQLPSLLMLLPLLMSFQFVQGIQCGEGQVLVAGWLKRKRKRNTYYNFKAMKNSK